MLIHQIILNTFTCGNYELDPEKDPEATLVKIYMYSYIFTFTNKCKNSDLLILCSSYIISLIVHFLYMTSCLNNKLRELSSLHW